MRYRVHLANTKSPSNTKILITDAETVEEAVRKVERSVNPDGNYLLDGTEIIYRTTEVWEEVADPNPKWVVSILEEDGTQRVLGIQ